MRAQLPLVRSARAVLVEEAIDRSRERPGVVRRGVGEQIHHRVQTGFEGGGEFGRIAHETGDLPHLERRGRRVDIAQPREHLHGEGGVADGFGHTRQHARGDAAGTGGHHLIQREVEHHRDERPDVGEDRRVVHGRQVGAAGPDPRGLLLLLEQLGPLGGRHHESLVGLSDGEQMRLVVERVLLVGRRVITDAEDRGVQLLHGDGGVPYRLHTDTGEVDVEVAAEEPAHLRRPVAVVLGLVRAHADRPQLEAGQDRLVEGQRLAERTRGRWQHLARVRPRVMREAGARWMVGEPGCRH